jgi:hypothetical protein
MASLKMAVSRRLIAILIAPFCGFEDTTVGIVPVVKLHTKLFVSGVPIVSVAPVVMVAVYSELAASRNVDVKVAVVPEYETVPDTGAPFGSVTRNVLVLMAAGFMALLKVAVISVATGTAVAPLDGETATTTGTTTGACSRPQPASTAINRKLSVEIVRIRTLRNENLRIISPVHLSKRRAASVAGAAGVWNLKRGD